MGLKSTYISQKLRREIPVIQGFSKLTKEDKIKKISENFENPEHIQAVFQSFWHEDKTIQKKFDELSENTISNYHIPYGVAPNFLIDGKNHIIPMVIEESSVVAAASNAAKFWSKFGGFHTEITSVTKVGQVHFTWTGETNKLRKVFPELKNRLIKKVKPITANMEERGGGIIDIQLLDKTEDMENYYQLFATFDTVDSMGANFINSCLEEFAAELKTFLSDSSYFTGYEKDVNIIMSILSNYTPECRVKCWVETDIKNLESLDNDLDAQAFAKKFEKAVQIATIDPFRATTHNKGIFNGIDAVILATGNDFRAIEAAGHAYASRKGKYQSLTKLSLDNNTFRYELELPLSLGTVGGLTRLHPLVVRSLELLDNPDAKQLMRITAAAGLANNFSAIKSLITKGIQIGHMKMHLLNILNTFDATSHEKSQAMAYFKNIKVSYANVADFISTLRKNRSN